MSINAENMNCDKLQQLEKDLRDMEVAYDELVEKYERTKAINEELNEQLTCSKKDCEQLRKDNDKLGMEAARSHEALNEKMEEINRLRKQINNWTSDWAYVCNERDKYKNLNKSLNDELYHSKIDCHKLNDTNNLLKKDLNNKIDDWMDVCEVRDKYKELNLNLQRELQEQKDRYSVLKEDFDQACHTKTSELCRAIVDKVADTNAEEIKSRFIDILEEMIDEITEDEED